MLKSKFNLDLKPKDYETVEENEPEEERLKQVEMEEEKFIEETEEEKIAVSERKLNRSEVSVRLSLLGKNADGDGYTYLKATCTGMGLQDISALKSFHHLQFINVSDNLLTLENLQVLADLPFIVLIHADNNKLSSAALKKMKYLQVLIMNHNNISSVNNVFQPELSTLEVGYNKITNVHFDNKMPQLKCLDFKYNMLRQIIDLDFPNLDSLYLAGNKISSLIGIERLTNLRILHVRNNPIKFLNGFSSELKKLQYVNLRNCKITTLIQVKKLRVLPALDTLILKGCPYMGGTGEEAPDAANEEENDEVRIVVLAALPRLKRLNKGIASPDERTEANDMMMQWLEEGENDEEEEVNEEMEEEASIKE